MTIRETTPADFEALLSIWLRSVRETHTFLTEEAIQELLPLVRDQALPALELWVLVHDGEMIGFAGLDGAKLEALFLDPAHFRRGGGRLLLEHARRLRGALSVDVNEQHTRRWGFGWWVDPRWMGRAGHSRCCTCRSEPMHQANALDQRRQQLMLRLNCFLHRHLL